MFYTGMQREMLSQLNRLAPSYTNASSGSPSLSLDQLVRSVLAHEYSRAQTYCSETKQRVYKAVSSAYENAGSLINRAVMRVNVFTQNARNTLYQATEALLFSEEALQANNPEEIHLAQEVINHQIQEVEHQLQEAHQCYRENGDANQNVAQMRQGNPSLRLREGQEIIKHSARELSRTLEGLLHQREALAQRLETLGQRDLPMQDIRLEDLLILIALEYADDASATTAFPTNGGLERAFTSTRGSASLPFLHQETHQNCQTLIAKEQYGQLAKEAQKLPESLRTSICAQLLQSPVKESALAAAKEFLSMLSNQGQIYCKCLIALVEGKPQDMLQLAKTLSNSGKMTLTSELMAQGKLVEAEKIVQTMTQGPEKNYALCALFMTQGKDALVILQAQQTKLPDNYKALLCEKFISAGKPAEAMLLAAAIKTPSALQSLCKAFLLAGFLQEAVELAKNLPPEMQLALAKMLLEAGCLQEAMELAAHMPMEEQTALFQMLLQKNPKIALQLAAKILQNPEQAKQLIQILLNKGLLAEAKLLLRLANNPQLEKELAQLLAQEESKKSKKISATIECENDDPSSDEEDEESNEESSSEEEEEEEEEEEQKSEPF